MVRNPPTDVDHVVFTDHSIRRRPTSAAGSPPTDAELVPFEGEASTRDRGLAYAMVGRREENTTYVERAFHLLAETAARGGTDAQALAYLAEFYRDRKDDARALPLYRQAWRMDPTQSAVAAALGAYQMQYGNIEAAISSWDQALTINPTMLLVRANLAGALLRTGHVEQAQATLRKALDFSPSFQPARELLNSITKTGSQTKN
jgi:tetratricopeptide (TPR) repeat protein